MLVLKPFDGQFEQKGIDPFFESDSDDEDESATVPVGPQDDEVRTFSCVCERMTQTYLMRRVIQSWSTKTNLVEHVQDDAPKFLDIYYHKRIRRRKRNSSAYS